MQKLSLFFSVQFLLLYFLVLPAFSADTVGRWMKFEQSFTSSKDYGNPLYDVKTFSVYFTSPSGRVKTIHGFWDGGRNWKVRFAPDETGTWTWESTCSDTGNTGLHQQRGTFVCVGNNSNKAIYQHGSIIHPRGSYHLEHADGTPFFWAGCTAWNGTLKSTAQEWDTYLSHRAENGYSVIQFVTTQWRGAEKNSLGEVAFEGAGRIKINPDFFQHLDQKIDKINAHGLIAAPVLLWALAAAQGRELSPGYFLPDAEAILLARYMVARYGGNQIIWILGGDGKYIEENEQRWKNIGKGVFADEHPGLVALHPGGASWIGEVYAKATWLDIIGYQSGHSNSRHAQNFINRGPVAQNWDKLPPRPIINMEPVYEEINPGITAADVRNAAYWSILNAPTAGITYGANGIWPWLRTGEQILNHGFKGETASRWNEALELPGSRQIGYLANFMRTLEWWKLRPSPELLVEQPGDKDSGDFVSVSRSVDGATVVIYFPKPIAIKLYNLNNYQYKVQWFDPVSNEITKGKTTAKDLVLNIDPPTGGNDCLLVLTRLKR